MAVAPEIRISRFLNEKRKWRSDGTIKPSVFKPGRDGLVSVFDTENMSDDAIWRHADEHFGLCVGRGDANAGAVVALGLSLTRSEPPERHIDVGGFPISDGEDAVLDVAEDLADLFELKIRTD